MKLDSELILKIKKLVSNFTITHITNLASYGRLWNITYTHRSRQSGANTELKNIEGRMLLLIEELDDIIIDEIIQIFLRLTQYQAGSLIPIRDLITKNHPFYL